MPSTFKIVIIGAGGVGKSCFTIQFVSSQFVETYDPTLEDSYRKQTIVDGEQVVLNIYDTAGQEDFSAVRDQYMRIGEGFICVYSITHKPSFSEVTHLHNKLQSFSDNLPVVLVGNKVDMEEDRTISTSEGQDLSNQFGWKFLEASAKIKLNVVEAFEEIVRSVKFHRNDHTTKEVDTVPPVKKKGGRRCTVL